MRRDAILRWGREGTEPDNARSTSTTHPFEVDEHYRNRRGEYKVVSLDGPDMVIEYDDGTQLETSVQLQERIWRNIQLEKKIRQEREEQRKARKRSYPRPKFEGFEDTDFQQGVRGTTWRRKSELGGLLARRLTRLTPFEFNSYPVRGKPRLDLASVSADEAAQRRRGAKFVLELNEERARYGFNIRRKPGQLDDSWQWPTFMEALEDDAGLQRKLEGIMRKHDLVWEVRAWTSRGKGPLIARVTPADEQAMLNWTPAEGEPEVISWAGLADRLQELADDTGCDVDLAKSMEKDQAIAAGKFVVTPVTEVYRALVPIYESSVEEEAEATA